MALRVHWSRGGEEAARRNCDAKSLKKEDQTATRRLKYNRVTVPKLEFIKFRDCIHTHSVLDVVSETVSDRVVHLAVG